MPKYIAVPAPGMQDREVSPFEPQPVERFEALSLSEADAKAPPGWELALVVDRNSAASRRMQTVVDIRY